jgi:hypothetical protein
LIIMPPEVEVGIPEEATMGALPEDPNAEFSKGFPPSCGVDSGIRSNAGAKEPLARVRPSFDATLSRFHFDWKK